MGGAPPAGTTGLTYDDLRALPTQGSERFELIDGELLVTPAPSTRHQDAAGRIYAALLTHTREHGGRTFPGPVDVLFSDDTVLQPDVVAVGPDRLDRIEADRIAGAPDLVVEVSSPATRTTDLVSKRRVYERHGVVEYWFVDLDADQVHLYRLRDHRYGAPEVVLDGGRISSTAVPGLSLPAAEAVALDDSS